MNIPKVSSNGGNLVNGLRNFIDDNISKENANNNNNVPIISDDPFLVLPASNESLSPEFSNTYNNNSSMPLDSSNLAANNNSSMPLDSIVDEPHPNPKVSEENVSEENVYEESASTQNVIQSINIVKDEIKNLKRNNAELLKKNYDLSTVVKNLQAEKKQLTIENIELIKLKEEIFDEQNRNTTLNSECETYKKELNNLKMKKN